MKKKIATLAIVLWLATTSTAFANRGHHYRNHRGYNHGYHSRPHHYKHFRSGHHNDSLGIAVGVVGGLLLGSALMYSTAPPRRTAVHREPYTTYQPEIIVRQPRICIEERIINGQWQTSRYDGRQVWVSFLNPVRQRVQVPCY